MIAQKDYRLVWNLIADTESFQTALTQLAETREPIAIDTERASGYTYYQRAYLIQIKCGSLPVMLFDPLAIDSFEPLAAIINQREWILHSGRHDLPYLNELGLYPAKLRDTEHAARLLGYERFKLGTIVAQLCSVELEKAYSNVDWSTRPLESEWLEYAAYDVEFLAQIAAIQQQDAAAQQKTEILTQEFQALKTLKPKTVTTEMWRRTSRITELGADNRALAIVREMWQVRDAIARSKDLAPHRILPDSTLITTAQTRPRSATELSKIPGFQSTYGQAQLHRFWRAVVRGKTIDEDLRFQAGAAQQPKSAATAEIIKTRISKLRKALTAAATAQNIPLENYLDPAILKKIAASSASQNQEVAQQLRKLGARPWQITATNDTITKILTTNPLQ